MLEPRISAFYHCSGFEQRFVPDPLVPPMLVPIEVLNNITPLFIPTAFSFAVGAGIVGFNLEATNTFKYAFISPSGNEVLSQEVHLPIIPNDPKLDADMQGIVLNLNLQNVVLNEEGYYLSRITFNNKQIGEYSIKVKAVNTNA